MKGHVTSRYARALASLFFGTALILMLALPYAAKAESAGWQGEYFNNPYLWGQPALVRTDSSINFYWGLGSPDYRIVPDGFSVRWTRTLYFDAGQYQFFTETDDGVRLYIDGYPVISQWKDQIPTVYSAVVTLSAGNHTIIMEYYENTGAATARLWWQRLGAPAPTPTPAPSVDAWRGEYYANRWLSGSPALVRYDADIKFDWGIGSPDPRLPADDFSVRWTRDVTFESGYYRFTVQSDDGVRLYIDGRPIIDRWFDQPPTSYTVEKQMTAGVHTVMLEYYERGGGASIFLWYWKIQPPQPITAWRGEYYNNRWLYGPPAVVRNDNEIKFNWGMGSPDPRINPDNFAVRWTREMTFQEGRYEFTTKTDDGVRLWIDDRLVIDQWRDMGPGIFTYTIWLSGGTHRIRMEYYENAGAAQAELTIRGPLPVPSGGNLITCVGRYNSWVKVYQRTADGRWLDINPRGWGPVDPSGYLKIDGLPVDYFRYGMQGHPYKVELWVNGRLVQQVGNTDIGQPEFRIRPNADNYTPWRCPVQ
jgi:hypothetical protein